MRHRHGLEGAGVILTVLAVLAARSGSRDDVPNPRSLHLKSLKLRNFKGIAELDLTFDESLTLLAGVNGVGKTSVMQALLAAITHTWGAVTPGGYPYFQLEKNVVRAGTTDAEISLALGFSHGSDCEVRLRVEGIALKFGPDWRELRNGFKRFARALPLVVYYEQDRIAHSFAQIHELTFSSRLNWETSLKTTITSPNEFKAWFFEREADEGQIVRERQDLDYADPELEVVRTVLNRLEGFTAVRSRRPSDSGERILYLEKDGANIPFDSLSRGEQAFFNPRGQHAKALPTRPFFTPLLHDCPTPNEGGRGAALRSLDEGLRQVVCPTRRARYDPRGGKSLLLLQPPRLGTARSLRPVP